jgi:hypothetical protein
LLLLELKQLVVHYMPLAYATALGGTSHFHYKLVKREIALRVSVLFTDWSLSTEFRVFMQEHDIVISGSALLPILLLYCLIPGDLDIYIPYGALNVVHHYLLTHTEYHKIPMHTLAVRDSVEDYQRDDGSGASHGLTVVI